MKFRIPHGILIVDILSVLLIFSILFIPSTIARIILGIPFLLFFPGYTMVAALFVKKDEIDIIERIALSGGMSIAVSALIGFGLNYTTWGIRLESALYSITAFIFITSIIALIRRAKTLETNKFTTEITLTIPKWEGNTFNKSLTIILIIAIVVALGVLVYTITVPKIGEKFTEFYILGINGKAQDYPTEYIMENGKVIQVIYDDGTKDSSELGKVTLGIVNHERQTVIYFIKMTINDEPVNIEFSGLTTDVLGPVELEQGEKWENQIGIVPQYIGQNQKLDLLLVKDAETTPEYSLRLWIDVTEAE